jgi:hypothetical protein
MLPMRLLFPRRSSRAGFAFLLLLKLGEKRVMLFLLLDCGGRPVAGANQGVIGQGEDFSAIGIERVLIGDEPSAD